MIGDPLREQSARLERLDGLLESLTDVLDIREVFDRVSHLTQQVLPHDVMGVLQILNEEEGRVRLHVTAGLPNGLRQAHESMMVSLDPDVLRLHRDPLVVDDVASHPLGQFGPAGAAGLKSAIAAPIRFGGRLQGAVSFLSRKPARFASDDIPIAKRIASHIALSMSHEQLAEEARRRHALEAEAAALTVLDHSLASLIDSGPLDDVFERISELTKPLLPHDALALPVILRDGTRGHLYASSGVDRQALPKQLTIRTPEWEYDLVGDLSKNAEPDNAVAARMGFRSALRLPIRLEKRFVGALAFLSRTSSQYTLSHVPFARRVADRIAISLERERRVEQTRRADEATERAAHLEARVRALSDELDARTGYRRVIGESRPWKHVLTQAAQVAATDATVLLLGESGTGKEVVARFIHRGSTRRDGPFVALNCAALPEHLLEAELFGYERGAFTGAVQSKPGQIEQAAGGVLFLDEVAEMTLAAQAKFLRVLQEREFQRLGGTRQLRADVRVVAATNRDLQQAIERGTFREDVYYRLNVFPIRLPPLRERRDDILALSESFIKEIGRSLGRPPAGFAKDARQALLDYHLPGNVRELHNIIERAAILADGGLIIRDHLAVTSLAKPAPAPPSSVASSSTVADTAGDIASMERAMIEKALRDARFNKARAAKTLGLTRSQLYGRLKRFGLE